MEWFALDETTQRLEEVCGNAHRGLVVLVRSLPFGLSRLPDHLLLPDLIADSKCRSGPQNYGMYPADALPVGTSRPSARPNPQCDCFMRSVMFSLDWCSTRSK